MVKQAEVSVGDIWTAKVSNKVVNVKVTGINKGERGRKTRYTLLNLRTNRVVEKTAAALRRRVRDYPSEGTDSSLPTLL